MVALDLVTIALFVWVLRLSWRIAAWGFKQPSERWARVRFLTGALGLSAIAIYCAVYIALVVALYALLLWTAFVSP